MTFEIMKLAGRRVADSFRVEARTYAEADRKSKPRRQGWVRYRIAKVTKARLRHGGVHEVGYRWRNHLGKR